MNCSTEILLSRLECVKPSGNGRWMARCPAHDDRSPSLSIRELDDGRLLLHDFGMCEVNDVLAAVGMSLSDLFPEKLEHHKPAIRDYRQVHAAREALTILASESLVLVIAADNLARGIALDDQDRARLTEAAARIQQARKAAA